MSQQIEFGPAEESAAWRLIELALAEDLNTTAATIELDRDLTCATLVDPAATATIDVVIRREGVLAGVRVAELVFQRLDPTVSWQTLLHDGTAVRPGDVIARVSGPLRSLLIGERTALNFLMHLSGVATLTRRFVEAITGTKAVILDTRKTLPAWRLLEKYAVRCGGGTNHRMGLSDGVLIKDNHLAAWAAASGSESHSIAAAVRQARDWLRSRRGQAPHNSELAELSFVRDERSVPPILNSAVPDPGPVHDVSIEVEVDTLEQLRDALAGAPDIVLLDNMSPVQLRDAIKLRDELAESVRLEASGGIMLGNVREIAETGVDRISIGALTHSAPALDIAFEWHVGL